MDTVREQLVIMRDQQAVTSSLKVAEVFEKGHQHVLRNIDNLKKDLSNFGQMFAEGAEPDSYGRDRRVYYMNRDGFTLLAMGFTGKEALKFKLKYIEAFNAMEAEIKKAHLSSYMIADPIKRAEKWIEEETLRKEQAQQIEEMKPKALFADAVAASDGTCLIGELAKMLTQAGFTVGQNRLFSMMRCDGFLGKNGCNRNVPLQRYVEMGLFKIKETAVTHADGHVTINRTPKVTGKGQRYFMKYFTEKMTAPNLTLVME